MLFPVIIPAYNCKLYLRDCVDSVQSQSFIDFEVVLVNDGSTDGTSTLRNEIAVEPWVAVLHQANRGASLIRNVGMEHARGDYVVFLDADDELSTDYLGDLAGELRAGPVDVILGSVRTDFGKGVDDTNVLLFDSVYTGLLDLAGPVNYFFTTADDAPFAAWHNVYSRAFLSRHRLTFDEEMILSEDRDFVLRVLAQRPVWRCVCVPGYRHCVNVVDSVTGQVGIRKILRAMAGDEKWIRISYENELLPLPHRFLLVTTSALFSYPCSCRVMKDAWFSRELLTTSLVSPPRLRRRFLFRDTAPACASRLSSCRWKSRL